MRKNLNKFGFGDNKIQLNETIEILPRIIIPKVTLEVNTIKIKYVYA